MTRRTELAVVAVVSGLLFGALAFTAGQRVGLADQRATVALAAFQVHRMADATLLAASEVSSVCRATVWRAVVARADTSGEGER